MSASDFSCTKVLNAARRRQRVAEMAQRLGYSNEGEMLYDLYVNRKMSMQNMARTLWMSYRKMRELLVQNNVPIRDLGERLHNGYVEMTEALVDEICKDGIAPVAYRLRVDPTTLRYHLQKWVTCRLVKVAADD